MHIHYIYKQNKSSPLLKTLLSFTDAHTLEDLTEKNSKPRIHRNLGHLASSINDNPIPFSLKNSMTNDKLIKTTLSLLKIRLLVHLLTKIPNSV